MQPVKFPDATAVVVTFLNTQLDVHGDTAPVGSRVPSSRPTRFVLVRRLGGPRLNRVADNAMLGIECWGTDEADAHDLAQLCRALVHSMPGTTQSGVAVYGVTELSGPGSLPDPLSDSPRFTFTVQVTMRGTALEAV